MGTREKCNILGSTSDPLSQNLHFCKLCGGFVCVKACRALLYVKFLNRGKLNWQTWKTICSSNSENEVSCCQERRGFIIGYNHSDGYRNVWEWGQLSALTHRRIALQSVLSKEVWLSVVSLCGRSKQTPRVKTKQTKKDGAVTKCKAQLSSKIRYKVVD